MENIEIFFAENPGTPPRTTENTTYEERKSNWDKRIIKAKEQAKLKPISFTKVFSFANEFVNMLRSRNEKDEKENIALLALDDENQAIILDNGIIACGCSWEDTKWNQEERRYEKYDFKYERIKERFDLTYPSDIIWMKFTDKGHLGVVAKSFDINFKHDNTSGKLINEVGEKWDDSFVFIFPLAKEILNVYKKDDIERAIGNYLISKGIPIIDFYSHNY